MDDHTSFSHSSGSGASGTTKGALAGCMGKVHDVRVGVRNVQP
jgi:hypothetical protein